MTPGDLNTGTDAQSPLVSLISVTPNSPVGTVTVTFSSPVSQVLAGDGSAAGSTGSGVTITDANGVPIPVIDARPTVTGLGTAALTLSFTGSGVVGGQLPEGIYQLNFVGNGIIANGRATDVANNGTQIDSYFEFEFTVAPSLAGDYDQNGTVEQADYTFWKTHFGEIAGIGLQADGNGNGSVDAADYTIWRDNLGATLPGAGAGGAATSVASAAAEVSSSVAPAALASALAVTAEPVADTSDPAAAPAALELAFVDLAFVGPDMTSLSVKAAGADAASLRVAAGGSAPLDRSLLLAARQHQRAAGPELQDEAICADHSDQKFGDVDEFFATLGAKRSAFRSTWAALRHAS
jgi:hypothetical protein